MSDWHKAEQQRALRELGAIAQAEQDDHAATIAAALERARVVGVLDGWAHKNRNKKAEVVTRYIFGDDCMVWQVSLRLQGQKARNFEVQGVDDARASAAAAVEAGEV